MIPIRIRRLGGLGNTMFQYMLAQRLCALVPDARVANVSLPEFGVEIPDVAMPHASLRIDAPHDVNLGAVAHALRTGVFRGVQLGSYAQRLEYYDDRKSCAALFVAQEAPGSSVITDDTLVINVRGREVLEDTHPDYGPVPVAFFQQIVEQTGLAPVIVGQLGEDAYSREIRRRFGGAPIIESRSPAEDFELVRSAKHLVFGVSTFSWLAGWLSEKAESVYMPVSGIFDPDQRPDIDLLPVMDERYRFFQLPGVQWTASAQQVKSVLHSTDHFEELSRPAVRDRLRNAHENLLDQRLRTDPSALNALQRQRDRASRRAHVYSTRLSNMRAWARFLSMVDMPELDMPTVASESEMIRVRPTADAGVHYRLRLRHQATDMTFAVDVTAPRTRAERAEVERIAAAVGAKLFDTSTGQTMVKSAIPVDEAASWLSEFVASTLPLARRDTARVR